MQRKGLGKGLADLIPVDELKKGVNLLHLRPHEIEPNPFQPRSAIRDDQLEELTRSIERHGIVQPLVVRPVGDGYQLVTGERRWRAAQRAGLDIIPCLVRDTDDSEALQVALVENLQREDLNPLDAARGYRQLVQEFGLTQDQVANIVGKSRSAVANTLRLLELPAAVQSAVERGEISEGHARALLGVGKDEQAIEAAAQHVIAKGLTVRETEEYVRLVTTPEESAGIAKPTTVRTTLPRGRDPNATAIEERLQRAIGTKVRVRTRKRGGTLQIWYHNADELDRIVRLLDPPTSRFGE
ncbi:MAG: ParB/RepB/Spo0J family partition protein [Candidatus Zipacnadales bacterium]